MATEHSSNRKTIQHSIFGKLLMQHLHAIASSFAQLSRSPLATFLTFAVIGFALALPLGLSVLLKNMQSVSNSLHDSGQISLYLQQNISAAQINQLLSTLRIRDDVAAATYISPQQGLQQFQQYVNLGNALQALKDNPLPSVIVIEPNISPHNSTEITQLMTYLHTLPGVDTTQLDMHWLQRLNALINLGQRVAYALGLIFAAAVILIIGNTIRLTTQQYQDEIILTKLLGGTPFFIRRPFLYSGMIYGLLGGIIAWFIIDVTLSWLQTPIHELATLYSSQFILIGLNLKSTLILLGGGMLLGFFGSWLAVKRHIDDIEPSKQSF